MRSSEHTAPKLAASVVPASWGAGSQVRLDDIHQKNGEAIMKTLSNRNALIALALVAGASSSALADFNYANFGTTAGLSLVGVAQQSSNSILVTPSVGGSAGAVWAAQKQDISLGFDTTMTIHIQDKVGGGADGIALVIQNAAPTPLGGTGGGMGFARNLVYNQPGIANSFALELDMWNNNTKDWPEPGDNHLSFQSKGLLENVPDMSGSLANAATSDMSDGSTHTVRLNYTAGIMSVYLDGSLTASLSAAVDLSTLLSLDTTGNGVGKAWVGVTAATGGSVDREAHVLDSWNWTSTTIPAPGTATLMAMGGMLMVRRKR